MRSITSDGAAGVVFRAENTQAVQATLVIPFWLRTAPRSEKASARVRRLEAVAEILNSSPGAAARWEVLKLDWAPEPASVTDDHIWHPKTAVSRKGAILKGTFQGEEGGDLVSRLSSDVCEVRIAERSIWYFDYGICSLEYVFDLDFHSISDELEITTNYARFWEAFRETVMKSVHDRKLATLRDPDWSDFQMRVMDAFCGKENKAALIDNGDLFSLSRSLEEEGGIRKGVKGHICNCYGINYVFVAERPEDLLSQCLKSLQEDISLGLGVEGDGNVATSASDSFCSVSYGAIHTLTLVRRSNPREAQKVVEATRALLRYLWMGYGTLTEAARGLLILQRENYLGDERRRPDEEDVLLTISKIDKAGQIAHQLVAEFHFSMFWESELEYEIYHRAYDLWKLKDLFSYVDENLKAAAKTAGVLQDRIKKAKENRREQTQRELTAIALAISFITFYNTMLTITGVKDFNTELLLFLPCFCLAAAGVRKILEQPDLHAFPGDPSSAPSPLIRTLQWLCKPGDLLWNFIRNAVDLLGSGPATRDHNQEGSVGRGRRD